MSKILLTKKNSVWGVIVNPQSSNTYRHILNFPNQAVKEAFINKELFNVGDDYKSLLAARPEQSFTRASSTTAEFVVDPSTYPDETIPTLLNKDFCIIEEDGIEQFYTVTSRRNGNGETIIYSAELDIFFTYSITEMFNNQETEISRAMFDRYLLTDDNKYISARENYLDTPILNSESFDNDFSNLLFPVNSPIKLSPKVKWRLSTASDHQGASDFISVEETEYIDNLITNMKWQMVSISTKLNEDIPIVIYPKNFSEVLYKGEYRNVTGIKSEKNDEFFALPFVNFITTCHDNLAVYTDYPNKKTTRLSVYWYPPNTIPDTTDPNTWLFEPFSKKVLEDATLLKNSLQVLPLSPLNILEGIEIVVKVINTSDPDKAAIGVSIKYDPTKRDDINWEIFKIPNFRTKDGDIVVLGNAAIGIRTLKKDNSITDTFQTIDDFYSNKPSLSWVLDKKNINYEPKLKMWPYTKYGICSSTKLHGNLLPQNFTKNNIKFKGNNGYLTSNWGYSIEFENYGNINNSSNPFLSNNLNYMYEDFGNYGIPTDKNQWEEFITRNQSSQNSQFMSKGLSAGIGALGVIAAPFTGGASLGLTALAGASIAATSASQINQQVSKQKDIKASPNEIENNGSTYAYDFTNKDPAPLLQKYQLPPYLLDQIYDHIFKYGYSYNNIISQINPLLTSRYWFNYVEISDTFENISLQASSEIKQIINDTLENGVTIWHVRDLTNFKGIKNYELENWEMKYL